MSNRPSILARCAAAALAAPLLASPARSAEPVWTRQADALRLDLGNGVRLQFALDGEWVLGLQEVEAHGTALTSPRTVLRPLVAQEYGAMGVWPFLRLRETRVAGGAAQLEVELFGGSDEGMFRDEFVFVADPERVVRDGMTPELLELRLHAASAAAAFGPVAARLAAVQEARSALVKLEEADRKANAAEPSERTLQARKRLEATARREWPALAAADPGLQAHLEAVETWEQALNARALEMGRIHRDFYAFAHLRLPAESCTVDVLRQRLAAQHARLRPAGDLIWSFRPEQRVIAGWTWTGWRHDYRIQLDDHRLHAVRQVGTWEIGGDLAGVTAVNFRYRGLGGIEQHFDAAADGGIAGSWSTTEILPGAAGDGHLVSPTPPPVATSSLADRGYALQHRAGAWIARPARGAGTGFVDFQSRDGFILASFHDRQGNLRAVSEAFAGDRVLSQTDEQLFAGLGRLATEPQVYLTLDGGATPFGPHEVRTRWQELDQAVRDRVAGELGFVSFEPLPGVGHLEETGRPDYFNALAEGGIDRWAEAGVRMVVTHTPGWWTDPHRDGPDAPPTPGDANRVRDWIPTADVREPWRAMTRAYARHGMAYFIHLTGMSQPDGPFVQAVGADPARWGMNAPHAGFSHGYPPLRGHNLHHAPLRELLLARLADVQRDYGFQGFWADSFQNMYMSQLAWGDGSGAPMQRVWWEQIAAWSRAGLHWMGESHSFPGLSCSIEVPGWENAPWYFPYTWKWLRGTAQSGYAPEELDRLTFRFMANKCWIAPDKSYKTDAVFATPSFTRLANEYMAALPSMRRSWALADEAGMLWLPFDGNAAGVWFPFREGDVPEGVRATGILDGTARAGAVPAGHTLRVEADDLLARFGLRAAPGADERLGRAYAPPVLHYPAALRAPLPE